MDVRTPSPPAQTKYFSESFVIMSATFSSPIFIENIGSGFLISHSFTVPSSSPSENKKKPLLTYVMALLF